MCLLGIKIIFEVVYGGLGGKNEILREGGGGGGGWGGSGLK